jgi:hypothetical protein
MRASKTQRGLLRDFAAGSIYRAGVERTNAEAEGSRA